jgi:hypothetical protein
MAVQLCEFTKTHQTIHFKKWLYHNKAATKFIISISELYINVIKKTAISLVTKSYQLDTAFLEFLGVSSIYQLVKKSFPKVMLKGIYIKFYIEAYVHKQGIKFCH